MLGDAVRDLRTARGWSQAGLHRVTGIAQQHINRIEKNQTTDVGLKNLEKLAGAFGISVAELLERAGMGRKGSSSDEAPISELRRGLAPYEDHLTATQRAALIAVARAMIEPNAEQ